MTNNSTDFSQYKKNLFKIAYKMLGSISDAEDLVQETWLRWNKIDQEKIDVPGAYLTRILTHLCIDLLRSRKLKSAEYSGPWLPSPLFTEETHQKFEDFDELSIALLFLLERLNPKERAVFVLKEAFDFSHTEIAEILKVETSNCRQLLSRAKKTLKDPTITQTENTVEHTELMEKFVTALWNENIEEIKGLLSEDARAYTDGGGIVNAALIPIEGPDRIAQIFLHLVKSNRAKTDFAFKQVNGAKGIVLYLGGEITSVVSIQISKHKICNIYVQRNPEKLKHLSLVKTEDKGTHF